MAEPAAGEGPGDAALVMAHVGAAAVCLSGRVVGHRPVGRADDPQQGALLAALVAGDAGSGRNRSTLEPDCRGAYDATSPAAALAGRFRGLLVPLVASPSAPTPTATGSPASTSGSAAPTASAASTAAAG